MSVPRGKMRHKEGQVVIHQKKRTMVANLILILIGLKILIEHLIRG